MRSAAPVPQTVEFSRHAGLEAVAGSCAGAHGTHRRRGFDFCRSALDKNVLTFVDLRWTNINQGEPKAPRGGNVTLLLEMEGLHKPFGSAHAMRDARCEREGSASAQRTGETTGRAAAHLATLTETRRPGAGQFQRSGPRTRKAVAIGHALEAPWRPMFRDLEPASVGGEEEEK
jgi:hypothetical protein